MSDDAVRAGLDRIRARIATVIVGLDDVVEDLLVALLANGHVLLEGPPGLGKTRLVRTLSTALDLDFRRIQCTPDLMPSDVTGAMAVIPGADGPTIRFEQGPVFTNVLLADEVNRTTPKTQAALLEAMEERTVTSGGTTHTLPDPFLVLATQNPIDMEGTYPLPEAQLDRFLLKVHVPQPSADDLVRILDRAEEAVVADPEPVADRSFLSTARTALRQIAVATPLKEAVARLIRATHGVADGEGLLRHGASPRGALAVVDAARGRALLAGRPHVGFVDLQRVALPALRHRVLLSFEAEADGRTTDDVLRPLVERHLR